MKKLFILFMLLFPVYGFADAPSTSCPTSDSSSSSEALIQITNNPCPSGYLQLNMKGANCEGEQYGQIICYLYASANYGYTDEPGTYEFTDHCPFSAY